MKFPSILPKEEKFYHFLTELARHATTSTHQLVVLIRSDNNHEREQTGKIISDCKTEGKKVFNTVNEEICRTFITPFDREDIQAIATILYRMTKLIEKTKDRVLIHELHPFNKDFTRFAEVLTQQAQAMEQVMKHLTNGRHGGKLQEQVNIIHNLEDDGDHLMTQAIAEAFVSIQDTREVILRKDIYEMLERLTDLYRDVGNVALQILLKHS